MFLLKKRIGGGPAALNTCTGGGASDNKNATMSRGKGAKASIVTIAPSSPSEIRAQMTSNFSDRRDDGSITDQRTVVPSDMSGRSGAPALPVAARYKDQPEVDYDIGPTDLYNFIENKQWESAVERAKEAPAEAKTWISRREPDNPDKIRWRLLPLHATCVFRAPLDLIEALIKANPDAPSMVDDQGMLPIHLACRNGASRGVVLTLLTANPDSIKAKDRKGRTSLALVENSSSQNKDTVMDAIQSFNQGTLDLRSVSPSVVTVGIVPGSPHENEVDYGNRTILFRLILKKDWDGVAARLVLFPEEAKTWIVTKGYNGNLRFLPLHKACVLNPPPTTIDALVKAFPEGVTRSDQDGWLPLHCACFYAAPQSCIEILIDADAKATQKKDDDGRMPLHYACLKNAPEAVVSRLLNAHPKAALAKDNDGRMPLHHACSKAAQDSVIETLVKAGPKAAQSKDDNGRLPLHLACKKGCSKHAVQVLLQVHPRGPAAKDDQEKLPVHHACQSGSCSPTVVLALLDSHPESIHSKNAFGLTPLAEARQPKQGVANMDPVVAVLERFKAEQDRMRFNDDETRAMDPAYVIHLEQRVVNLTNRVDVLQDSLGEICCIASTLKTDLMGSGKKKDVKAEVIKFCDAMVSLKLVPDSTVKKSAC